MQCIVSQFVNCIEVDPDQEYVALSTGWNHKKQVEEFWPVVDENTGNFTAIRFGGQMEACDSSFNSIIL